MLKIIVEFTKVIILILIGILMNSCTKFNSNFQSVSGNGNVVTVNRTITEPFTAIKAKTGLQVIVKQSPDQSITIEADENLQDHIFTEVKEGCLEVYSDANIRKSSAKKVYITLPELTELSSSSGANVTSANTFHCKTIDFDSSSGSNLNFSVEAQKIDCESSSGSTMKLNGQTVSLETDSSSGSSMNLENLVAQNVDSEASSGSSTHVNPTENLKADASSGASITYVSQPKRITTDKSSGGSVSLQ
ncbi:DUF2807 domain-containing protein [Flavobacterium sp. NRK F10]|uniref:head GIN domain-containing protein n=1 Tax=Flavobacterium sp. NRK F10 TaxID=2954931 RepID=UPI002091DD1D|nr:head GIN domain-containing protein [Flavobacterium sp. NRK F10]MCO6175574.1 DUF2807 domain-containing protein [Flavobacterium sp. NRK F10]